MGGRTIAFLAGLPVTTPAQGMDRVCISGVSALHQGSMDKILGCSDLVLVCGMEHMTHVPLDPPGSTDLMAINPRFFQDESLKQLDFQTAMSMGLTAEKLHGQSGITREEMDEWSLFSHQRAARAVKEGYFAGEILPVEVEQEDGSVQRFDTDLSMRASTTMEKLAELKPAFKPDGQITAGNSSSLNAGATAVLLMNENKADSLGLKPLARVVSMEWTGVDPGLMGVGPFPASRMTL